MPLEQHICSLSFFLQSKQEEPFGNQLGKLSLLSLHNKDYFCDDISDAWIIISYIVFVMAILTPRIRFGTLIKKANGPHKAI